MFAGKYHIYPQNDSTAFSITQQCKASLALPMSMLMLINFVSTLILMSRSLLWLKMKVEPYVNRRCFNVKMSLLFHRIVIVISLHFKVSTIFFFSVSQIHRRFNVKFQRWVNVYQMTSIQRWYHVDNIRRYFNRYQGWINVECLLVTNNQAMIAIMFLFCFLLFVAYYYYYFFSFSFCFFIVVFLYFYLFSFLY